MNTENEELENLNEEETNTNPESEIPTETETETPASEEAKPDEDKKDDKKKKVVRAPNVPSNSVELGKLCVRVGESWRDKFPAFRVDYTDSAQMLTLGEQLLIAATENLTVTDDKRANTKSLTALNAEINDSAKHLREYIRDEYSEESDLSDHYIKYGLVKASSGTFVFSAKNTLRAQNLDKLVSKMEEPNNPFAGRKRGLNYWRSIRDGHAAAWESSQDLKQDRSEFSKTASDLNAEIETLLRRFLASVKGAFYGRNYVKTRRMFGYLRENF